MSPEDESRSLLRVISEQVSKTHEKVIRVEERLVNLNDRVSNLDNNVEIIRSAQQRAGTEVAIIQTECARHRKHTSDLHKKVDALGNNVQEVEQTGRIFISRTDQTWKVVAIAGSVLVGIIGLGLAIAKVIL